MLNLIYLDGKVVCEECEERPMVYRDFHPQDRKRKSYVLICRTCRKKKIVWGYGR